MYIAIDDTYGPEALTDSNYVSGNRRTHIAVIFQDQDVDYFRTQINEILFSIFEDFDIRPKELHFVDIYNRKEPWDELPVRANLAIFKTFFHIYQQYKWPIHIQTIDHRTLSDHGVEGFEGKIEGLDLSKSSELSLFWLLLKIKRNYKDSPQNIIAFIDEGAGKNGQEIGSNIFHDWPCIQCILILNNLPEKSRNQYTARINI